MHWLNHFLVPFTILFLLFEDTVGITKLVAFTIVFSILPDTDLFVLGYVMKRKRAHLRTFIQEPFGFVVLGLPLALLAAMIWEPAYFFLVLIPYASHILLDYLTLHTAFPLAPFSARNVYTGFIRPAIPGHPYAHRKDLFSENHVMYVMAAVLIVAIVLM